ncbi:MAG: PT domain-containing protein [Clostridia bacterium]|nr:PT domain-containing protein [Clostridia bacterium]
MKKAAIAILALALAALLASCINVNGPVPLKPMQTAQTGAQPEQSHAPASDVPVPTAHETPDLTVEPTAVPTSEPSADPTAVPTAAPTTIPTAVPSPTPEIRELSFYDEAAELLRLTPVYLDYGGLDEDAPDDAVLYHIGSIGEDFNRGPQFFAANGENSVVYDMNCETYVYDGSGAKLDRFATGLGFENHAMLIGDLLYTPSSISDIKTGRIINELSGEDAEHRYFAGMVQSSRKPRLIVQESAFSNASGTVYTYEYFYYELNGAFIWQKAEQLCAVIASSNGKWTKIMLPSGAEYNANVTGFEPLGTDEEGNFYFKNTYNNGFYSDQDMSSHVIKLSEQGALLAKMEIPIRRYSGSLFEGPLKMTLADDGTVYIGAALMEAFVIWRVKM